MIRNERYFAVVKRSSDKGDKPKRHKPKKDEHREGKKTSCHQVQRWIILP